MGRLPHLAKINVCSKKAIGTKFSFQSGFHSHLMAALFLLCSLAG